MKNHCQSKHIVSLEDIKIMSTILSETLNYYRVIVDKIIMYTDSTDEKSAIKKVLKVIKSNNLLTSDSPEISVHLLIERKSKLLSSTVH